MSDERPSRAVEEAESRILAFVEDELLGPGARSVGRDDELLADEILDSVAVVRLAAFVEKEFQFVLQPADFVIENFRSVAVLADFVAGAAGRAARPPEASGR